MVTASKGVGEVREAPYFVFWHLLSWIYRTDRTFSTRLLKAWHPLKECVLPATFHARLSD